MRKTIGAVGVALLAISGQAMASGYRIPEQSVNSTARAAGYVAHTPAADAAYYNPANMSWLDDRGYLEIDVTWIHLGPIQYTDNRSSLYNGSSEKENFLLPTLFTVSPDYNGFRVGFSVTAPAGLSKRWQDPYPRTFSEEFTLKVFDINPSLSYKFCEWFSVAGGVRALYAEGKVKSAGQVAPGVMATRDLEGDSWEMGYNLALTVRPVEEIHVSLTYRSKVDLGVEGNASLWTSEGLGSYHGDAGVEIPVPAVVAVAVSYTFFDRLTVELEYDRTYWSAYETLDFNYAGLLDNPVLYAAFDRPAAKKWSDTDAWRLSISFDFNDQFILMAGFAIDENPVPDDTLGFELPDSDALLYSTGLRYRVHEDLDFGIAYLYSDKKSRKVTNSMVSGAFTDASAHLVSFGVSWKF